MINSAQKKSNSKKTFNYTESLDNIKNLGTAISEFQSIGTAKTGGERLQKIAGLIAKAYGAMK